MPVTFSIIKIRLISRIYKESAQLKKKWPNSFKWAEDMKISISIKNYYMTNKYKNMLNLIKNRGNIKYETNKRVW